LGFNHPLTYEKLKLIWFKSFRYIIKWSLPLLVLIIIGLGLHYTGFVTLFKTDTSDRHWAPIQSPHLKLQNLKGESLSLDSLKSPVIILNFWASWCQPCYKEFPEFIQLLKWSQGQIHLVAISVDHSKKDIYSFLKKLNIKDTKYKNLHIVWDPEYKMSQQFDVTRFPETFILNENLKIIKKQVGAWSFQEMKKFFSQMLNL